MSIEYEEKASAQVQASGAGEAETRPLDNEASSAANSDTSLSDTAASPSAPSSASKKRVKFPDELVLGYSDPPRRWSPGEYSTFDLLASYLKACSEQKTKPLNKLVHQLRALQDLQGINGEKVNVLNIISEFF